MVADVTVGDPLPGTEGGVTPPATESENDGEGPTRKWYYLTLLFLVVTVVYGLSVLALDSAYFLFPDELGLLLWVGVFVASGPLALLFWLDTRAVARANRNPKVVDASRLLGPWVTGIGGGLTGLVAVFVVPVLILAAVYYQFPLLLAVLWYLGSTRRKALRVSEEKPPIPPEEYQRAKELKKRGEERVTAGDTAFESRDYGRAATAYAEAVDAYESALNLVEKYAVDDSALRDDFERARGRHEEARRIEAGETPGEVTSGEDVDEDEETPDEVLARARELSRQGDERYASGDLDGAIEKWTNAAEVYDAGIDVFDEETAGDFRRLRQDVGAKLGETVRELWTAQRRIADEALDHGRAALDDGDYDEAEAAFVEAVEALETARDIETEYDGVASLDETDSLDDAACDARRGVVDTTLGTLEAELAAVRTGDEAAVDRRGSRGVLDRVRRELDDLETAENEVFTDDHHDRVASLRERVAIETLREAVIGQLAEMERAERLYAGEKFFEAREVYRRVRENVEALASEESASLTEEVADELSRVVLACELNVETIRKAIYEGDSTEPLVTTDEIAHGGPHRDEDDLIVDRVLEYLPGYTRVKQLGSGGFADIWVVRGETGRAALKIPRVSDYETIPESKIRRFVAEAENWQLVANHPNVVDVIQYGEKPVPWLLLELCEGTLRVRLDADAAFDDRVVVLAAVGDALGYANAKGIAHLDIKPENVLFDGEDVAKLGDWGLSKVMTEGTITGTGHSLLYAAPEQLDRSLGERDIRTDVYQYGVLAYELLTGEHPFEVGSREAIVLPSEVNPDLPDSVDTTLLKALAYDQTERYEQVVQVRDALTRALGVEA